MPDRGHQSPRQRHRTPPSKLNRQPATPAAANSATDVASAESDSGSTIPVDNEIVLAAYEGRSPPENQRPKAQMHHLERTLLPSPPPALSPRQEHPYGERRLRISPVPKPTNLIK
jgi:hypothetical protein